MAFFLSLGLLITTSIVSAQEFYDIQKINSTATKHNQEQLSKILEAPLFRQNGYVGGLQDYASYSPQGFDKSEPWEVSEETRTTVASFLSPVPSSNLVPPKVEAMDSFASYETRPEQGRPLPLYANAEYIAQPYNTPTLIYKPKYLRPIPSTDSYIPINPLSKQLDLPLPSAPNTQFIKPPKPSLKFQVPLFEPFTPFKANTQPQLQYSSQNEDIHNVPSKSLETPYPTLSQTLELGKSESIKPSRLPTKTFPKKYNSNTDEYAPKKLVKNIPVSESVEDVDITKIKIGQKHLQKLTSSPAESEKPDIKINKNQRKQELEKQRHKFEEAQKKIQAKKEEESRQQQLFVDETVARASVSNSEPVASESGFNNFHHGPENSFASPSHHTAAGLGDVSHEAGGDRTEFQMHGQHGPHSYKFGYDTGKGKNRQFRYEERDNDGYVKGHYGFYDKRGKLQVVNYDAHPDHGFHAEGSFGKV